jgi:hypothetical protein
MLYLDVIKNKGYESKRNERRGLGSVDSFGLPPQSEFSV